MSWLKTCVSSNYFLFIQLFLQDTFLSNKHFSNNSSVIRKSQELRIYSEQNYTGFKSIFDWLPNHSGFIWHTWLTKDMGYNMAGRCDGIVMPSNAMPFPMAWLVVAASSIMRWFTVIPSLHQTQIIRHIYVPIYVVKMIYTYMQRLCNLAYRSK